VITQARDEALRHHEDNRSSTASAARRSLPALSFERDEAVR